MWQTSYQLHFSKMSEVIKIDREMEQKKGEEDTLKGKQHFKEYIIHIRDDVK